MVENIIKQLESNIKMFDNLLNGIEINEYGWKSSKNKWSILEIVCHLLDEEKEDFRARVFHTLNTPNEPAPPIDPEGWVTSRDYQNQDYKLRLNELLNERKQSIIQLKELKNPNWDNQYHHPEIGLISAYTFLTNWLAHDYLHIHQIMKQRYLYLQFNSKTKLDYAGGL